MRTPIIAASLGLTILMAQTQPSLTKADMDRLMQELSNWGRWGKTDQMGTVNLITPAKRKAAAALVREGFSLSLSREADRAASADNAQPFVQKMTSSSDSPDPMFAMDTFTIGYHNLAVTHFDSLSHMFYGGKIYNGYSQAAVNSRGAKQLAVTAFRDGILSRGILMDIPRLKGVRYLELSTPIFPSDLEAWEKKTGIHVGTGDVVFVRTGRWARRAEKGPWNAGELAAGMHASCAQWFHKRDVAAIGSDAHGEVKPTMVEGVPFPLHQLLLIAMGTPMFDNCDLERLSQAAATRGRWEFLFTAAPLVVPLGTGSPLNPIATF